MSAGLTHETVYNKATVPALFTTALAKFLTKDAAGEINGGFGSILRSMTPGLAVRTGLPSLGIHLEDLPGRIYGVTDEAGAVNLTIIYAGLPAVGQVLVEYNVSGTDPGVPTLTFQAAVTGYRVEKSELPLGFDEVFDIIAT